MNITPEIKDQALNSLLSGSGDYDINSARILQGDGYANVIHTSMGDVFSITDAGKAFLSKGGYTALAREKERLYQEAKAAQELEKQNKLQEIEMQRIISEQLMEKDHEFQARQNKANRRNNIISGLIAAIISAVVALIMQAL